MSVSNRDSKAISEALESIRSSIPSNVNLVAVSKYVDADKVEWAYNCGQRDFGENRVEELQRKSLACDAKGLSSIIWHFIGNIQSNKLAKLLRVPSLGFIHSIDSEMRLKDLYKRIDNFSGDQLNFFLQVNTGGEQEKSGFLSYDELASAVRFHLQEYQGKRLNFFGLMTMGKLRGDDFERDARACFQALKGYRSRLIEDFSLEGLSLSMGMSRDYRIAIEEGSDFIRVGNAIFNSELES